MDTSSVGAVLIFGALSSTIASLIWLLMLRRVRPRIEISPFIAEESINDSPQWRLKLINRSRRAAVDISIEIVLIRAQSAANGSVNMTRAIPVGRLPLMLPGKRWRSGSDDNCYRIRIHANPGNLLTPDDGRYLRVRIMARDEVSGVGRLFEQRYAYLATSIVKGRFSKGQHFQVL
ncbi:MAG: hypothetical protein QG597_2126 [Actinomycetota bacterium]|nr:hypothetical protein [Actinomycetota bacterium]